MGPMIVSKRGVIGSTCVTERQPESDAWAESPSIFTLGLTNGWSIGNFPLPFALTITLEGLFFSLITSGLTAWLRLREHTETERS